MLSLCGHAQNQVLNFALVQMEPSKIELVPGYGVVITRRQLDEAEGESNGSPTRLVRNLMSVYFTREELANSSCYGSRINSALDRDILSACISELIPRTALCGFLAAKSHGSNEGYIIIPQGFAR